MNRLLRVEPAVFLLTWAAVAVLFRTRAFWDPGALWHVRVGDLILDHGIMRTDPFTFPFAGQTWIPQQWGGEVLMALAHRIGGFDAMLLGLAVLVAGLAAGLVRILRTGGMGVPLAVGVTGFALAAAGFHFFARPHMATVLLTAVTAGFLVAFDRRRIGIRGLVWLIPLFAVWTNLHGGMLGGLMMLGLCGAGWGVLFPLRSDRSPLTNWPAVGLFAGVCVGCGLSMFVNPIGLELHRTWFRIVGSPAMAKYVAEHTPLSLDRPGDLAVTCFFGFYLFAVAGTSPREWRVTWLLPVAWFLFTLKGVRQGPLCVVTACVLLADVWPRTRWHRFLAASGDLLARDPLTPLPRLTLASWLGPVVAVAAAFGLQAGGVRVPLVGAGWAGLDPKFTPVELTDELQRYAADRPLGTRIWNDANFGGFLIYHTPTLLIFMDDRFELCGDALLEEYADAVESHPERFDRWHAAYHFERALVATADDPPPLEAHLRASGKWREVARGRAAALYEYAP